MQYNQSNLISMVLLAASAIATGALVVYHVASNGTLLSYLADLQEGGSGPVGFTKGE